MRVRAVAEQPSTCSPPTVTAARPPTRSLAWAAWPGQRGLASHSRSLGGHEGLKAAVRPRPRPPWSRGRRREAEPSCGGVVVRLHVRGELVVHALLVRLDGEEELRERRGADGGGGGGPARKERLLELPLDQLEQPQQAGAAHECEQPLVEGRAVALAEGAVGEGARQVERPRRDAPLVLVARVGAVAPLGRRPLAVVPARSKAAKRAPLAAPGSTPPQGLPRRGGLGMWGCGAAAQSVHPRHAEAEAAGRMPRTGTPTRGRAQGAAAGEQPRAAPAAAHRSRRRECPAAP